MIGMNGIILARLKRDIIRILMERKTSGNKTT